MSLWTPDGERPVRREQTTSTAPPGQPGVDREPTREELEAHMAELQRQLAETPVEVVIANHAYGLFELAALHLSVQPPHLGESRLAIDALAALIEGLAGRLGEAESQLVDGLSQLRMAWVQVQAATPGGNGANEPGAEV